MSRLLNFQKIIMVGHVTNKVIIDLKRRRSNNFFKPLINGNIKYTKSINFLLIFSYISSNYLLTLHS